MRKFFGLLKFFPNFQKQKTVFRLTVFAIYLFSTHLHYTYTHMCDIIILLHNTYNYYFIFVLQLPYTWSVESNNGIAMKKPELDIPESGWVPSNVQVFRLKLPCTGVVSSEVHVLLTINITAVNPKHGDVSLVFHRNKICLKTTDMLLDALIGNDNIRLIVLSLFVYISRSNDKNY